MQYFQRQYYDYTNMNIAVVIIVLFGFVQDFEIIFFRVLQSEVKCICPASCYDQTGLFVIRQRATDGRPAWGRQLEDEKHYHVTCTGTHKQGLRINKFHICIQCVASHYDVKFLHCTCAWHIYSDKYY